jgi:hypothetical protein
MPSSALASRRSHSATIASMLSLNMGEGRVESRWGGLP